MKKIIIIMVLIYVYILNIIPSNTKPTMIEKIDLNLEKNELGISFLTLENSKSILLGINGKVTLIVLEYLNSKNLKDLISYLNYNNIDYLMYDEYIDLSYKYKRINHDFKFENVNIIKKDNLIINYLDYNLCIGKNSNQTSCDFIYYLYLDSIPKLSDKNKIIFYDQNIDEMYMENNYQHLIDSYILNENEVITLKVKKNHYDLVNIPY